MIERGFSGSKVLIISRFRTIYSGPGTGNKEQFSYVKFRYGTKPISGVGTKLGCIYVLFSTTDLIDPNFVYRQLHWSKEQFIRGILRVCPFPLNYMYHLYSTSETFHSFLPDNTSLANPLKILQITMSR